MARPKKKNGNTSDLVAIGVFFVVALIAWVLWKRVSAEEVVASVTQSIEQQHWEVPCAKREIVKGCSSKTCARFLTDDFVSVEEATQLIGLAEKGMSLGGGSGGPSILDLHRGGVSRGDKFINVFMAMEASGKVVYDASDLALYEDLAGRIEKRVREAFGVEYVYLTNPSFFSRMRGGNRARTAHDEYWHVHVDKLQYPGFEYTGLLYLNDYGKDFDGGEFVFVEKSDEAPHGGTARNQTIHPVRGRLLLFTSGAENPHQVREVTSGTRYALTIAFSCQKKGAVLPGEFLGQAKEALAMDAKNKKAAKQ